MENNVVTIDFETGRKPPEKVRRTKVNMFDLPLEKMPVNSVFRLSWFQYEKQYNNFFGTHPIHHQRSECLGTKSRHDYLKEYIYRYKQQKNLKTDLTSKRFRYMPVDDPCALDVGRTL